MTTTILVADDSATTRSLVAAYLSEWQDCEVVEAASGFEALKVLPARRVDLILTDINMPDINGLELLGFVRANPLYRDIPVIIITTENSAEDRKRGLGLGARQYLAKPFTPEQLRQAVSAVLGRGPDPAEGGP